jgi:predicted DNA-binding protein (MmcQ/YjbR family)
MNSKIILAVAALLIGVSVHAQQPADNDYLQKINKELPHKFKELKTGTTLEVIREQKVVKIYMLIDDLEQYEQILVERSDEQQMNYSQCKVIQIVKGKHKNNYIEVTDQYPLSPKMSNLYRIKTITADGIMRMYPPVPIMTLEEVNTKK